MRPILRYHGGKWKAAPWILSHFPPHSIYVEPFGGGGSVLLRKPRAKTEVYNDLDGEIVNVFRQARDNGPALRCVLALTPYARAEYDLSWEPAENPLEQARRTIVRSFAGFSSASVTTDPENRSKTGFRAYRSSNDATPSRDWASYADAFSELVSRLRGVVIENTDAATIIARFDTPETLHYIDPPYLPETRDSGSDYKHEMTEGQHLDLLTQLCDCKGKVVISGYASTLYDSALCRWIRVEKETKAQSRNSRTEVLWMNFRTEGELF